MTTDSIAEVGIDKEQRFYLRPSNATFPYIYREALDVHWDPYCRHLHSPKPREWTHMQWFRHIIDAAAMQSFDLRISPTTTWTNIPDDLRELMERWDASRLPAAMRLAEYQAAATKPKRGKLP